jgi:hypothetical protein
MTTKNYDIVGMKILLGTYEANTKMQVGLLQPLLVSQRPWVSVSMDFITWLSFTHGYNVIMAIVDHFSKYAIFLPIKVPCVMEEVENFFIKYVVKYRGLSLSIISDENMRFTRQL